MSERPNETGVRSALRTEVRGPVADLILDVPDRKQNVLTAGLLEELSGALQSLAGQPGVRALVISSGKPGSFCAGAEVESIGACRDRDEGTRLSKLGQKVYARIERLPIPVVAAISGPCLGGGLELALACDGLIAGDDAATRLGLPEVRLGIVPGFGGTQRLPRRLGLVAALDLILTGRTLNGKRALKSGLIDDLVPAGRLLAEAHRYALSLVGGGRPRGRKRRGGLLKRLISLPPLRGYVLRKARQGVLARTHGVYPAPLLAISAIEKAFGWDRPGGYRVEAEAVGELLRGDVSHALIDLFLVMEELKRQAGDAPGLEPGRPVGVVGAGVMGHSIARLLLKKGAAVRLFDVDAEGLRRGLAAIARSFRSDLRRRRLTPQAVRELLDRLSPGLEIDGLGQAAFALEAVVERLEVKHQVFTRLEQRLPAGTPIFTNTSSIPIERIATVLGQPDRVLGLHFFNPVDQMPLVEVIVTRETARERIDQACALARDLGKIPVVVLDSPGFLVNRVLAPYLSEALLLLEQGAAPGLIDGVMLRLGFPMGPLRVLDTVGLDVATAAAESLQPFLGERLGQPAIGRLLATAGHLGDKSGGGIYTRKRKRRIPAPWLPDLLVRARQESGTRLRAPGEAEVRDRLFMIMLAEAARAAVEGIVREDRMLDAALVLGAGFPAALGGPLKEIERRGMVCVRERLEGFRRREGGRFTSGPALEEWSR